jgi:hypothetical protein
VTPVARPARWPTAGGEGRTSRYLATDSRAASSRYADASRTPRVYAGGGSGERTPISMPPQQQLHSLKEQDEDIDLRESFNR